MELSVARMAISKLWSSTRDDIFVVNCVDAMKHVNSVMLVRRLPTAVGWWLSRVMERRVSNQHQQSRSACRIGWWRVRVLCLGGVRSNLFLAHLSDGD